MAKKIVNTDKAPKAAGQYSQAVKVGNLLFISGQIPIEAQSGNLVREGVELQTQQVIENIGAILHSVGLSYENVVKTTLYIRNMQDFDAINKIYAEYFQEGPPARACVEVTRLPRDVDIEIEAVATY
jgi:2-iminobutanoate/2-iminopropanoate deaminase